MKMENQRGFGIEKALFHQHYTIFYLSNETFIEIAPSCKKSGFGESGFFLFLIAEKHSSVHGICLDIRI